jgi:hypothetical protein
MPSDVLENLATLPPDKLREAKLRIAHLLGEQGGDTSGPSPKGDDAEDIAYDALREALINVGAYLPRSLNTFKRHFLYPKFREGVAIMADYITNLEAKKKPERVMAWRFLMGLLVRTRHNRHLNNANVRPSEADSIIGYDMPQVAAVVERSFPGYLRCGMLSVLIKKTLPHSVKAPERVRIRNNGAVVSSA